MSQLPMLETKRPACRECREDNKLDFEFTMAFQPFVDITTKGIFGYEALVRGRGGEGAASVLDKVTETSRYWFDQACRVQSIELATRLGLEGVLSINILPNAIYRPEACIRKTLEAADANGFEQTRLMFEVTEGERVQDPAHLLRIFNEYKKQGLRVAIDDFGAGYAGLNLLADFQPDVIKLDMALTRNIHKDRVRQAIVRGIIATTEALGIQIIAEGIETRDEGAALVDLGLKIFQGYYFAKPGFEKLPVVLPGLIDSILEMR